MILKTILKTGQIDIMAQKDDKLNEKDPLFTNKVAGGFLVACLLLMVVGYVGDFLYHPQAIEKNSFPIDVAEANTSDNPQSMTQDARIEPISPLLADASGEAGEKLFKRCASCHEVEKGGKNKVGPELWAIMGKAVAANAGFAYSDAMQALGGDWDYERMNEFLASPKGFVPGTKMSFAGLSKAKDRAALIRYLRDQADSPLPLP